MLLSTAADAQSPRWTQTQARVEEPLAVIMGAGDPSVLIVQRSRLDHVRTEDGGKSWVPFTVLGTKPQQYAASPVDPKLFYAVSGGVSSYAYTGTVPSTLYRSRDAGASWELLAQAFTWNDAPLGEIAVGAAPGLVYAMRMAPWDCTIGCVHRGAEAYVSLDGGSRWRSIDNGLRFFELYPSASDARVVYGRATGGLYRSEDQGVTWTQVRATAGSYSAHQVLVDRRDPDTVYIRPTGGTELVVTEDGGKSWRETAAVDVPGLSKRLAADPQAAGWLYFMGGEGQIFLSRDRARSWQRVAPRTQSPTVSSGREYRNTYPAIGVALDGKRVAFAPATNVVNQPPVPQELKRVEFAPDDLVLGSDLWWNPAESGWGLTITQHESGQIFAIWYTYDESGRATWYVVPGGTWTGARTFEATIYATRGPAYFQGPFDPSKVVVSRAGNATLRFADDSHATFSYALDSGQRQEKSIIRQAFGRPNDWAIASNADLYWNPAESGWGFVVNQQWGRVFATWFVYDDQGRPTWLVMPDGGYGYDINGPYSGKGRLSGSLYATTGPSLGRPFNPNGVTATPVGDVDVIMIDRDHVTIRYRVNYQPGLRELVRQPF